MVAEVMQIVNCYCYGDDISSYEEREDYCFLLQACRRQPPCWSLL